MLKFNDALISKGISLFRLERRLVKDNPDSEFVRRWWCTYTAKDGRTIAFSDLTREKIFARVFGSKPEEKQN